MDKKIQDAYIEIMKKELVPALGCTEPGAVAFAAAEAAKVLGTFPSNIDVFCSGNIIKNVKGVVVPNSGGMRGIDAAAVLGIVTDNPEGALEVLDAVTDEDRERTRELLDTDFCKAHLQEGEGNLYIEVLAYAGSDKAQVIIRDSHTNIVLLKKNDEVLFEKKGNVSEEEFEKLKTLLNVKDILEFADTVAIEKIRPILTPQLAVNTAIAEEGIKNSYGAAVGKILIDTYGSDVKIRAKAKAAAGSDARMGGSSMPVVINSGSGNQGITVTVPVAEYAEELEVGEEKLFRALTISNLVSIHIKRHIGKLSAFCGAVSAACGSGAAITYLYGGDFKDICSTITNTVANVGGIVCDGAKASCAAKIASSVDAAIMGHEMTEKQKTFASGEGIVENDIEKTIENIGHIGKEGMRETDTEIMHLMIGDK